VSLLERLGRGHLSDQQFARLWASGDRHPHLDACAACRAKFVEFDGWLMDVGDTLRAEADDAFPAERLAAQQAQIARRLETLERPARVIAFPKAARAVISGHSHVRRWVTVAAAAGLIAGVGLGQVVPLGTIVREGPPQAAIATPHLSVPEAEIRAKELTPVSTSLEDDELFTDAFRRPRVSTLSALDDMTPTARNAGK
jgi:hypothetical protein